MELRFPDDALALVSAALRHVRDAAHLAHVGAPATSPDQAYHLAGFGPECVRKASIASAQVRKILGHHLGAEGDQLLRFWLALEPTALRYEPYDVSARYPALAAWKPDCRYERSGSRSSEDAVQAVTAARSHVDASSWLSGQTAVSQRR